MLYNLLGISEKEKNKINKLIYIINELKINDVAEESLFQFSPILNTKDEGPKHQPWGEFYIDILGNEVLFKLIEDEYPNDEYTMDFHVNAQIYDRVYDDFINDILLLTEPSKKDIVISFKLYFKDNKITHEEY